MKTSVLISSLVLVASFQLACANGNGNGNTITALDMKNLSDTLFESYDKDIRPSTDYAVALVIYINVYLNGLNSLDMVLQKMVSTVSLTMTWTDEYLRWHPSSHSGIQFFFLPQNKVWLPDIAIRNGFETVRPLGFDRLLLMVYQHGTMNWKTGDTVATKCTMEIQNFPFDQQTCTIVFGPWASGVVNVKFSIGPDGFITDEYQANDEWTLVDTSHENLNDELTSRVSFLITMKRNPSFYITNIILPVVFLSILGVFTFLIPIDSGEKLGYTMTVFLSFAVFLTIVSSSLPVTSSASAVSVYLLSLLTMGTMIVMVTGVELRLHHRDHIKHPVPKWLCKIIKYKIDLPCLGKNKVVTIRNEPFALSNGTDGRLQTIEGVKVTTGHEDANLTWPEVTAYMDFIFFWIFTTITLSLTVWVFVVSYFNL